MQKYSAYLIRSVLAFGSVTLVWAVACSSARYPMCDRDEQCATNGKHDYCVSGHCAYCRTTTDCADRERCRVGRCEADPDLPALPEAGPDAEADAEAEAGDDDEPAAEAPSQGAQERVRALERRAREIRMRQRRP